MNLLIIEDEEDIRNALIRGFNKKGYAATGSADGIEGLGLAQINSYDIIILDLNLPGMDGLDVLREIRSSNKEQKILILSARTDYTERVKGLDLGANDYLIKPFDFGELEARVRNLLRRSFFQESAILHFFALDIDTSTRRVTYNGGNIIELSPKEYSILEYLLINRGVPVSSEKLIEHIWAEDADMFSNAVKVHISQLRRKLAPFGAADSIKHIRGAGYIIEEDGQ